MRLDYVAGRAESQTPGRFEGSAAYWLTAVTLPGTSNQLFASSFMHLSVYASLRPSPLTCFRFLFIRALFLPPSSLLLLSACLRPFRERGNVFIVGVRI